jgi:hypothetical protein
MASPKKMITHTANAPMSHPLKPLTHPDSPAARPSDAVLMGGKSPPGFYLAG